MVPRFYTFEGLGQNTQLANTSVIEREYFQGFIFEPLVNKDELSKEGSFMHHCVDSYFGCNLNWLFIFAVYPEDSDRFKKSDNRSTLAIQVSYKNQINFSISQNYTFWNDTPTEANRIACHSFIKQISKKHKSKFIEYINRLNESQKSTEQAKSKLVIYADYINQIANKICQ